MHTHMHVRTHTHIQEKKGNLSLFWNSHVIPAVFKNVVQALTLTKTLKQSATVTTYIPLKYFGFKGPVLLHI